MDLKMIKIQTSQIEDILNKFIDFNNYLYELPIDYPTIKEIQFLIQSNKELINEVEKLKKEINTIGHY